MISNKKGQIAETITWFVAFVIIFFIVMFFTFFTVAVTLGKKVDNKDLNTNGITMQNADILLNFLNSNTNYNTQDIQVKDLIIKYYETGDEDIKTAITMLFKNKFKDNYYFYFSISKDNENIIYINGIPIVSAGSITTTTDKNFKYSFKEVNEISQQSEFYLLSKDKIKINYFIEERTIGE
jgi:hypothetical protein